MSNTQNSEGIIECPNLADRQALTPVAARKSILGNGLPIVRHLPSRALRRIGPWCFLDHIGPTTLAVDNGVDVGPHPHIGLQTVTWLFAGAMLHKDSLGYEQVIQPGQMNLMTAGHGISHSEESPDGFSGPIHGLQFWIALPAEHEDIDPAFEHHSDLPQWQQDGAVLTLIVGELEGRRSPAKVYSPLVGADIQNKQHTTLTLTVPEHFELGLCVNHGQAELEGETLAEGELYYLGCGRSTLSLTLQPGSHLMLLGGEPLPQAVLMWWNFVGRDQARIEQALADWQAQPSARFGTVDRYPGDPLPAPPLEPGIKLRG